MATLLKINTSLMETGNANRLAAAFVALWRKRHPDDRVITRDLTRGPIPHLDETTLTGFFTPAEQRNPEQQAAVRLSDALIAELLAADVVVLGVPMYNFGIPSTLKAWIDHVARAGITFKYTENGPVGLIQGKQVFVLAARGGVHQGTPQDTQTGYLRNVLGFLGMTDVRFVYAEGLALGEAAKSQAEAAALGQIAGLIGSRAPSPAAV
ncbi:FMN-dependent NADH-azoreductase [Methylocaldum sp.]|uniref:FMN-dependent NADH-azoreductase n=1 Tax=Methylocaldum sp. TaxID=1969727 RepID=UPI002D4D0AEF|nr:NAD(P)H-dependent oxidoreductase [Methylocaldum sp.]HYE35866.1 NAD(P)H-dependent oxidoreductase [Methylocaldum sp.]